jgi:hypothetical protein
MNLIELLRASPVDINQVAEYFNANVLPQAVADANANFSPRRLVKRSRAIEPLPTDTRQHGQNTFGALRRRTVADFRRALVNGVFGLARINPELAAMSVRGFVLV